MTFGKKAAATVDIFEDFLCPNCLDLEKAVGTTLDADVRANRAQVHFHTMSILDASSNNDYSTRAANAALCASDVICRIVRRLPQHAVRAIDGKQVQPRRAPAAGRTPSWRPTPSTSGSRAAS